MSFSLVEWGTLQRACTIADGEPLPFAARFCSPGWLPGIKKEAHLKDLREYFCAVDGEGKLVLTKQAVFDMISSKKGRDELAKSFKDGSRVIKWTGVRRWKPCHLYNIQCSEIFTLRYEKLHTEA